MTLKTKRPPCWSTKGREDGHQEDDQPSKPSRTGQDDLASFRASKLSRLYFLSFETASAIATLAYAVSS
jgi:hypothetical protein